MSNKITNHIELRQRIRELETAKLNGEDLIKQNGLELIDLLNPVNIVKKTIKDLAQDAEVREDALSAALHIGADFVIGKIFRSNKSVKGHLFTEIFGKLAGRFINGNSTAIKDTIIGAIDKFSERKN